MQNNTITVTGVDVGGVPTDQDFLRSKSLENRSVFTGPASTLANRDDLTLSRRYNVRNGNSQGVAEARAKFATDTSVPGVETTTSVEHLASVEVIVRIPVGMSDNAIEELVSRATIFMGSTEGLSLIKDLSI